MEFWSITQKQCEEVAEALNSRPRKRYKFSPQAKSTNKNYKIIDPLALAVRISRSKKE